MALYDLAKKTFTKMAVTDEPDKTWGDLSVPRSYWRRASLAWRVPGEAKNGAWALYVVNHGGRQSIEMYELKPTAGNWALVWRGCEVAAHDYNDVAILRTAALSAPIRRDCLREATEGRSAAQ